MLHSFASQFQAPLQGLLHWSQWDALSSLLAESSDGNWYVYHVGETVPTMPLSSDHFRHFLRELGELLRRDHQEEYLGIVYVDGLEAPTFIKIYDPNDLGASCGSSGRQVLPGWIISRTQPVDLKAEYNNPGGRRRWWQKLFDQQAGAASSLTPGGQARHKQ